MIKNSSKQTGTLIEKINQTTLKLFDQLVKLHQKTIEKHKSQTVNLKEKIGQLQQQVQQMHQQNQINKKAFQQEAFQIKQDIDQLFGGEDLEYKEFKQKMFKLKQIEASQTPGILKEIYKELTQERLLPASKDPQISALAPQEVNMGIHQNFVNLQRSTALRILKIFQTKTYKDDQQSQTWQEFIQPAEHSALLKEVEKNKIKLLAQEEILDGLRKESSAKQNNLSKLQAQKQNLLVESGKLRRELQSSVGELKGIRSQQNTIVNEKKQLEKNLEKETKEKERLDKKVDSLLEKITGLNTNIQKLKDVQSDKEKKIQHLEKKLRNRKKIKQNIEEVSLVQEQSKSPPKPLPKVEEEKSNKELFGVPEIPVMKSRPARKRSPIKQKQTPKAPQYVKPSFSDSQEEVPLTKRATRKPTQAKKEDQQSKQKAKEKKKQKSIKDPRKQLQKSSVEGKPSRTLKKASLKPAQKEIKKETQVSSPKLRDSGPEKPSPPKNKQSIKNPKQTQSTPTQKHLQDHLPQQQTLQQPSSQSNSFLKQSKISNNIQDQPQSPSNSSQTIKKTQQQHLIQSKTSTKSRHSKKQSLKVQQLQEDQENSSQIKSINSEQDLSQIDVQVQALTQSSQQVQSSEQEVSDTTPLQIGGSREEIRNDGKKIIMVDKGVWSNLIRVPESTGQQVEVGIQYNWENPDQIDFGIQDVQKLYVMPFNPNNIYGLRGDSYFHSNGRTFQAQPRIPDMQNSIVFKSPYKVINGNFPRNSL